MGEIMALYEPFGATVKIVELPAGSKKHPNIVIGTDGEVNPLGVLEVEIVPSDPPGNTPNPGDIGQRFDILVRNLRADGGINEVCEAVKAAAKGAQG
jgi:hypothetical protein